MKLLSLFLPFLVFINVAFSQQVIKDLTANKFKVVSVAYGSKPCPLMTEVQRNALSSPQNGDCIYNTTALKLNLFNGTIWKAAGGGIDIWATSFGYAVNDLVIQSSKIYQCQTAHTSGTFATDLGAGKWTEISQGVTDHTQLTSIGTNTHAQIDTHIASTSNPHNVTAAQVGLGNVDNTSDATKNAAAVSLTNKTINRSLNTITNLNIVNADVSSSAAIDYSKLATLNTGQFIFGNAGVPTAGTMSGGATIGATGVVTLGNTAVTSQLLTGYVSGAGTVTASDSILSAIQKLNGNVAGFIPASTATTKGDILVATGSATVVRHGVGSNNQVLTADSAQTDGTKWADPQISTKAQNDGSSTMVTEIQAPYSQITPTATGKSIVETDSDNMLVNPDFEGLNSSGVATGWTNSSTNSTPTITTTASEITSGKQAQKIVLAAGVLNFSQSVTTPTGIQKQGYVLGTYSAPSTWTDFQVCSTVDSAEQTCVPTASLILDGAYHQIVIPTVFGATNAGIKYKTTSSVTGSFFAEKSKVAQGLALKNVTIDSDWATYTPTFTSFGTVSTQTMRWRRVGSNIEISGRFVAGTTVASEARISLPSGLTSASDYVTLESCGASASSTAGESPLCLIEPSSSYFTLGQINTSSLLTKRNGNNYTSGSTLVIDAKIRIQGWSSNTATYSQANSNFSGRNDGAITIGATTTAPTKGTIVTDRVMSARQGNRLIADYQYEQSTTGTAGSGDYLFTLPSGLSFDTNSVVFSTSATATSSTLPKSIVGYGHIANNGSNYIPAILIAYDATRFRVLFAGGGVPQVMSSAQNPLSAANVGLGLHLDAPISSWSDNGIIYGNFDKVSASYYMSANSSVSTSLPYNMDTKIDDSCTPACVTTGSAWKFTAPKSAKYCLSVNPSVTVNSAMRPHIYKNSTDYKTLGYNGGAGETPTFTSTVRLAKGEWFDIRPSGSFTAMGGALNASTNIDYIDIWECGNY